MDGCPTCSVCTSFLISLICFQRVTFLCLWTYFMYCVYLVHSCLFSVSLVCAPCQCLPSRLCDCWNGWRVTSNLLIPTLQVSNLHDSKLFHPEPHFTSQSIDYCHKIKCIYKYTNVCSWEIIIPLKLGDIMKSFLLLPPCVLPPYKLPPSPQIRWVSRIAQNSFEVESTLLHYPHFLTSQPIGRKCHKSLYVSWEMLLSKFTSFGILTIVIYNEIEMLVSLLSSF